MVSRLNPVDIGLSFEDMSYQLGDEIRGDLELVARRDIVIRKARIDLVCKVTFTELGRLVPETRGMGRTSHYRPVPSQEPVEVSETRTFRGEPFMPGRRLRSGSKVTERVVVSVPAELPEEAGGTRNRSKANLDWTLTATLDVSGGRDVTASAPIRIGYFSSTESLSAAELERRREVARRAAQESWDQSRRDGRDPESDSQ